MPSSGAQLKTLWLSLNPQIVTESPWWKFTSVLHVVSTPRPSTKNESVPPPLAPEAPIRKSEP